MTDRVTPLPWDTDFFGVAIGRADLEGATVDTLGSVEAEARDKGIECLYATIDPRGALPLDLQRHGWALVELGMNYERPAGPLGLAYDGITVRLGTVDDLPVIDDSVARMADWSRFAADPRFGPDAAVRMHRAWVDRAARDGERWVLLVAEDEEGVVGMCSQERRELPHMELVGITRARAGVAWALMDAFIEWGGGGVVRAGPAAARNVTVLRWLQTCGFSIYETRYTYHRWFDAPGRT